MPRSAGISVENSFVKGLVTEATGLSFPENACTETFDCIFKKTGEVCRRKGFEYESSYSLFTLTAARSESAVTTFLWTGAGGDGNSSFVCVQVGRYIYFYAVAESLSANKHSTSIDLDSFDVAGTTLPFSYPVEFSQGDGKLFVVGQFIEPFYVTYTPASDTISAGTQITISIRDFEGDTNDTLDVSVRPTATVTTDTAVINAHLYNLMNQGWANTVLVDTGSDTRENPIKDWDAAAATLPSNSDRWWQLKNADDQMDMAELDKFPVTSTETPKGHFVFNAFNVNRSTATGSDSTGGQETFNTLWGRGGSTHKASTLQTDSTSYRPTTVAFFANRVFYAGVNDTGYNDKIYFSQILTDISHAGHCYQEQDPTSETLFDLLATDGGVISIPDIATVVKMMVDKNNLYIFASNGIWVVTGSDAIGFSANDYSVQRISTLQCLNNDSYVSLNGTPAWVNGDGIWVLQSDQTLGSNNVTSISKDSIQSFFEEIPSESIPTIKGVFNQRERLVYWLYKSEEPTSTDSKYEYDRVLVFNTETGAFYPWRLNTDNDIKVIGMALSSGFSTITEEVEVLTGATELDNVVDSLDVDVTEDVLVDVAVAGTVKFLTENTSNQITWAEPFDTDYLDWTIAKGTGKNYSSYFITGYKVKGEGIRTQQTGYVTVHSRVETNSSVRIQGVWDYYTSDGARWSTSQQGYKAQTGSTYSERRLKIRGNGLALQMRFASDQGRPFNVIGWSTLDSITNVP